MSLHHGAFDTTANVRSRYINANRRIIMKNYRYILYTLTFALIFSMSCKESKDVIKNYKRSL